MAARLKVTQIKSKISEKQNQRDTLRTLGLKRIGDVALQLEATGAVAGSHRAGKGDRVVTVTGAPVELLLFLYGRQAIAEVEVTGSDVAAVETARTAAFGI